MPNESIKWNLFMLALVVVHFFAITTFLKMLGILEPLGLFLFGAAWVWCAMPVVNAWLVQNTIFGRLWWWARSSE